MNRFWYRFTVRIIGSAIAMMALTVGLTCESLAQMKPAMKIKLNVAPSINVSGMDANIQSLFAQDLVHLNELSAERTGGTDSISLGSGFSISAYENITVLLSFTPPKLTGKTNDASRGMRILCGYLNDGTTFFRRATITNNNSVQFRLRNNSLLKRSMKLNNPLFVAYVFFLIDQRKEKTIVKSPKPVSIVTIEFM